MSAAPIACSLGASERVARGREWDALLRSALLERRPTSRGARLRFARDDAVAAALERLVAAERECCPFLELELSRARGELVLEASGPPEAVPVIEELFAPRRA